MAQYQCRSCNFKFEAHEFPKKCPYCSRVGTAKPVPLASDILQEIEEQEKKLQSKEQEQ